MNTAQALLDDLARHGITVKVDGDTLLLNAPRGVMTPELAQRIKAAKPDLLALLRGDDWQAINDRTSLAVSDAETAQGKRVYGPGDAMPPEPASIDEAALDLLILSYACGRRAKTLAKLGVCPAELAEQIHANLKPVAQAVGDICEDRQR